MNSHPTNKDAIFISAGDRQTFASFAMERLSSRFDILINFYGNDAEIGARLEEGAAIFQARKTTKFKGLKEMYERNADRLAAYRSVWVCDDDMIVESGEIQALVVALDEFKLDAVAPGLSLAGKVCHPITWAVKGPHAIRLTNFIEMNAPMFSGQSLRRYIEVFDGSLDGWGNDWWFLNVFDANNSPRVGIVDEVVLINPADQMKPGGYREIDRAMPMDCREAQWISTRDKLGLREWAHRNLFTIYRDGPESRS